MHCAYKDIRDKLGDPMWWDEQAVPRYATFDPEIVANIYAREVALVEIACQGCGRRFPVAFSWASFESVHGNPVPPISERIIKKELYYKDPPNVGCCSGVCSTSVPLRVLEFWKYGKSPFDWERLKDLEISL
jgi:hypothetical protein